MEISGRQLQKEIINDLEIEIAQLKNHGINPCIAIVTLGSEESWQTYVLQKIKMAKKLGVEAKLINIKPETTNDVIAIVEELNENPKVHGLIVQRPFPTYIDTERVIQSISNDKDTDGFRENSIYDVPAWLAIKHIITHASRLLHEANLQDFLLNQSIVVVGKGGTAGKPVINGLKKLGVSPQIIDSKTKNRDEIFRNADIIITAVGKSNVVPVDKIKDKSILIGIGIHRENGKLTGDFNENEARGKVLFYTPTPGGVGPVNLAYLFKNLITAAKLSLDR